MYRLRPIESLIGKFNELENQEIYFASPEELNDPMEGLRDVFWQGDDIIWKNFIINYTKSLEKIFALVIILDESKKITADDIQVSYELLAKYSPKHDELINEIINEVFKVKFIRELPNCLSKRTKSIRRSELLSQLQILHQFVLNVISQVYFKNGLTIKSFLRQNLNDFEKLINNSPSFPEIINQMEKENSNKVNENLFEIIHLYTQSNNLRMQFQYSDMEMQSNFFFLLSEFPNKFLDKLENEIYPKWYSASFLECNKNSAVWGHYGDNHKGVCLEFQTKIENGKTTFNLETEYGYSSGPIIGMRPHFFKKIEYHNKHVEIDFFRTMGRLRKFEIDKLWYKDTQGNISVCASHFETPEKEEIWRENYWKSYDNSLKIKLKEWEYENEQRLIVHGDFIDYSSKESRKLKYDFNDLKSITFGIKTPNSAKLQIIKIIKLKCKENDRDDFVFYQAYYSKDSGKIESFKLDL
jgi:hypothetical protein